MLEELTKLKLPSTCTSLSIYENLLLVTSTDKKFRIFDMVEEKLITEGEGHNLSINQGLWDKFGEYFFTCSDDGTISLWSKAGNKVNSFIGHTNHVQSLALDNKNLMLLSGGTDCSVFLWDIRSFLPISNLDHIHQESVTCLSFSEDSSVFFTGSYDGKIHLWDTISLNSLKTCSFNRNVPIARGSFLGSYIYCSCLDSTILLWNAQEMKSVPIKNYSGHLNENYICDSQADKKGFIFSGSEDGALYLWNLNSEEMLGKFQIYKKNRVVNTLAFKENLIACCSFNPTDQSSYESVIISKYE